MHVGADTASHQRHVQGLIHSGTAMTKLDIVRDMRVFTAGRLLRATAIDELPQVFNVLSRRFPHYGIRHGNAPARPPES